jgi:hypothetical protein
LQEFARPQHQNIAPNSMPFVPQMTPAQVSQMLGFANVPQNVPPAFSAPMPPGALRMPPMNMPPLPPMPQDMRAPPPFPPPNPHNPPQW